MLQTAVGEVSCIAKNDYRTVRMMFDSGSQRTYITERVRKQLHLPRLRTECLIIHTFGNTKSEARQVDVVQLKVRGKKLNNEIYIEAICVPTICSPLRNQEVDMAVYKNKYEHLKELELADNYNGGLRIEILVGLDFYYSFMENEIREGLSGPVALKTIFGWVLCGRYDDCDDVTKHTVIQYNTTYCLNVSNRLENNEHNYIESTQENNCDEKLNNLVTRFYDVENFGINDNNSVVTKFQKELSFNGKRYVCKLPIKPYHEFIPDNHSNAIRRLYHYIENYGKIRSY